MPFSFNTYITQKIGNNTITTNTLRLYDAWLNLECHKNKVGFIVV